MLEKEKNFKLLLELRPFVAVEVASRAASLAWTGLPPFHALSSLACLPTTFFLLGFPSSGAGNRSPCLLRARPSWSSFSFQLYLDSQSEFTSVFHLLCPQRVHGPHCLLGGLLHDSFHALSLSFIPVIPASVISLVLETTLCRMAMCLGFPPASGGSFGFTWLLVCSFNVLFCFSCISGKFWLWSFFIHSKQFFEMACCTPVVCTIKNPQRPR